MTLPSNETEAELLPEAVAQRLLARVVELDARESAGTSIHRLREVTRELGIADATFDRALLEVRAQPADGSVELPPGRAQRSGLRGWWRSILGEGAGRPWPEDLLVNAGVFAAFFATLGVASRLTAMLGGDWQLRHGLFLATNLVAVAVARRYRARPVALVLATTAVAQGVEYVMHLAFGIRAVQSGPTHWAVLLAVGVALLGAPYLRSGGKTDPRAPSADPTRAAPRDAAVPTPRRRWWWPMRSLRRQPNRLLHPTGAL